MGERPTGQSAARTNRVVAPTLFHAAPGENRDDGHEDAEPREGQGSLLLPLRGRPGGRGARIVHRNGESTGARVRLVRRRRAVSSARPAFGKRIEGVFAEKSSVRLSGFLRDPLRSGRVTRIVRESGHSGSPAWSGCGTNTPLQTVRVSD